MAYEKQNWKTGDVVTSAKLNHMEDGIAGGGGVFVVPITFANNKLVFTKTFQEVKDAADSGSLVLAFITGEGEYVSFIITNVNESTYGVIGINDNGNALFTAESANDYPSMDN